MKKIPSFKVLIVFRINIPKYIQNKIIQKVSQLQNGDKIHTFFVPMSGNLPQQSRTGIENRILKKNFSRFYFVGFTREQIAAELERCGPLRTVNVYYWENSTFVEYKKS